MNKIDSELEKAIEIIRNMEFDSRNGLTKELFLMVSTLTPIPNVDLLIQDENGRILLSWRDDIYFGKGWHIPGGCIRFGETMEHRIQSTAENEIGCKVEFIKEPIAVRDVICYKDKNTQHPFERGHHITILYDCKLPQGFTIDKQNCKEGEAGYLKWFDEIPENMLKVHDVYSDVLRRWIRKE